MKKYEVLQQELQQRDRASRLSEHDYTEKNTKFFAPVLESANRIHQQLASSPPNGQKTKKKKKTAAAVIKKEESEEEEEPATNDDVIKREDPPFYEHYFQPSQEQNIDKIFGIRRAANGTDWYFGRKSIRFTNNDGFALVGSPPTTYDNLSDNVWSLIMLKDPLAVVQPTEDDTNTYKKILYSVGMNDYVSSLNSKLRSTLKDNVKWKDIVQPLTITTRSIAQKRRRSRKQQKEGQGLYTTVKPSFLLKKTKVSTSSKRKKNNRKPTVAAVETKGSGIEYLPEDISSLRKQLFYLTAEFHSGNSSVRNKIVAILKNLRNRSSISPQEYRIQLNSIDE